MSSESTTRKGRAARWDHTQPLDPLAAPFGWTDDGYRDLRGVPINRYRKVLGRKFLHCDFSEADFSGVELKGLEFSDCRFTATKFTSLHDIGNLFAGCIFTGCSFREAYLGMRPRRVSEPSRYEDCKFVGNDFARVLFRNAIFRGAVFDGNHTVGLDFGASGFWDCRFIGLVEDVWFRGGYRHRDEYKAFGDPVEPGLHRVDFSQATLCMISISEGCPLEDVTLPADQSCTLVNNGKLLEESTQFSAGFGDDSPVVAKLVDWLTIRADASTLDAPQEVGILCRDDLVEFLSDYVEHSKDLAAAVFKKAKQLYRVDGWEGASLAHERSAAKWWPWQG